MRTGPLSRDRHQPAEQGGVPVRVEGLGGTLPAQQPLPLKLDIGEMEAVHRHVGAALPQTLGQEAGQCGLAPARCAADADQAAALTGRWEQALELRARGGDGQGSG